MEIVVNDTNILIDLYNAGLLPHCKSLDLDFRTLDVVMSEIEEKNQLEAVEELVSDGTLRVDSLSPNQVERVFQMVREYEGYCNLSPEDISVMVYAKDNHCRLLTGDKTLRAKAIIENIQVSGVLYLTDLLSEAHILSYAEMAESLEFLLASNSRLPRKLIQERISRLREANVGINLLPNDDD